MCMHKTKFLCTFYINYVYDKRENFYIHLIREECKIFITNDKILFLHLIRTNYV